MPDTQSNHCMLDQLLGQAKNFESFASRQLGLLSAQLLADCAPERYLTGGYESSIGFLVSLMHNCLLKQGRGGLAD